MDAIQKAMQNIDNVSLRLRMSKVIADNPIQIQIIPSREIDKQPYQKGVERPAFSAVDGIEFQLNGFGVNRRKRAERAIKAALGDTYG